MSENPAADSAAGFFLCYDQRGFHRVPGCVCGRFSKTETNPDLLMCTVCMSDWWGNNF